MPMPTFRLWRALLAAVVGSALLANSTNVAAAGGSPQLEDPRGDWPLASSDVLSVTLGTVKNRKGVSAALSVTMRVAAPVDPQTPVIYTVNMMHGECAGVAVRLLLAGELSGVKREADVRHSDCGDAETQTAIAATVQGDKIVWQVPLTAKLPKGTQLVDVTAATTPGARARYPLGSTTSGTPFGDRTATGKPYSIGR